MKQFLPWIAGVLLVGGVCVKGQEMSFLAPRLGEQKTALDYRLEGHDSRSIKQQPGSLSVISQQLDFMVPLSQSSHSEWGLTGKTGYSDVDTSAKLYDSGNADFPNNLYEPSLGGFYRRRLDNGWLAGLKLEAASPSDRPFASWEETQLKALGMMSIPGEDRDAWYFFLAMNTRQGDLSYLPLPGIAYYWQPDDTFHALLGFPFASATYQPADRWKLSARYSFPRQVNGEVSYECMKNVVLYTLYRWDNRYYFRADRQDEDDMLYYYEQRVAGGLRWQCTEHLSLDFYGGYAFDRFFFEGEDYSDRGQSRLSFSDGPIAGVTIGLKF